VTEISGDVKIFRQKRLLCKKLPKSAKFWSTQKHLYQQVSRRRFRRVLWKSAKIPILKINNGWKSAICGVTGLQPRSVREDSPTALRSAKRKPLFDLAEYAGRCSPMCGKIANV
jgi:hypothetical protein